MKFVCIHLDQKHVRRVVEHLLFDALVNPQAFGGVKFGGAAVKESIHFVAGIEGRVQATFVGDSLAVDQRIERVFRIIEIGSPIPNFHGNRLAFLADIECLALNLLEFHLDANRGQVALNDQSSLHIEFGVGRDDQLGLEPASISRLGQESPRLIWVIRVRRHFFVVALVDWREQPMGNGTSIEHYLQNTLLVDGVIDGPPHADVGEGGQLAV